MTNLLRVGWFRSVHVKNLDAREYRALLWARSTLVRRLTDIENSVRGLLRGFGIRLASMLRGRRDTKVREATAGHPTLTLIMDPLLIARSMLRDQVAVIDKRVRDVAREDPVCKRLMSVPRVGPIVALTYRAEVDNPSGFNSSKSVGASFGLRPRRYQSGETDGVSSINRAGDSSVRVALLDPLRLRRSCDDQSADHEQKLAQGAQPLQTPCNKPPNRRTSPSRRMTS